MFIGLLRRPAGYENSGGKDCESNSSHISRIPPLIGLCPTVAAVYDRRLSEFATSPAVIDGRYSAGLTQERSYCSSAQLPQCAESVVHRIVERESATHPDVIRKLAGSRNDHSGNDADTSQRSQPVQLQRVNILRQFHPQDTSARRPGDFSAVRQISR